MADASAPLGARLNYAQVWEDARLLEAALPERGRILCIASGGDNAFALALRGAEVDAIDLSRPQLAVTELKLVGARLDHADYRALLGVDPGDAVALYRKIRAEISAESRAWLDDNEALLAGGILRAGRFERYLALFRTRVLPLVHRERTVLGWFDLEDRAAQRDYYERVWDTWRWRLLFRLFFSRPVMAARGRSPEQFAHVEGPVGEVLLGRVRRMLTERPLRDNGYVQWMLAGRWLTDAAVPAYLSPEGQLGLRDAAPRIRLVHADLASHLAGGAYDGFALSDVFEYLSEADTEALYHRIAGASRPGARIAFWNLFVPRGRPASLADRVVPLDELSAALHERDRAFVYGGFRVEEVR